MTPTPSTVIGKATGGRHVVLRREAVFRRRVGAFQRKLKADGAGTAQEPQSDVALSADPLEVVGRSAGQSDMEHWPALDADVDRHRRALRFGRFLQGHA